MTDLIMSWESLVHNNLLLSIYFPLSMVKYQYQQLLKNQKEKFARICFLSPSVFCNCFEDFLLETAILCFYNDSFEASYVTENKQWQYSEV